MYKIITLTAPRRKLEKGKKMSKEERLKQNRNKLLRSLKSICRTAWFRRWQQWHER
jgi:hypothetical protein